MMTLLQVPVLIALAAAPAQAAADAKVHIHAAPDAAFNANAYLVETPAGVIAVDAPFTVSEAKKFRATLDKLRKPLLAVLVTHAHPDHVNGITELVRGSNVPVVSTAGVLQTLKEIDGPKREYWGAIYKDDYPKVTTFPNKTVSSGGTIAFGGARFTALDLGEGESASETVWVLEGSKPAAFVGDLVMNRTHPWLAEGRSAAWISSLDRAEKELKSRKVAAVYPGHGNAGTLESLAWQRSYLQAYRAAVKELAAGKAKLDDAQKKALTARMEKYLPNAPLAVLIAMSADPVAAELAAPTKK